MFIIGYRISVCIVIYICIYNGVAQVVIFQSKTLQSKFKSGIRLFATQFT